MGIDGTMRIAKSIVTILMLAAMSLAVTVELSAQGNQPAKKTQTGKQPPKSVGNEKRPKATEQPSADTNLAEKPSSNVARRDPFEPLVSKQRPGGEIPKDLPPGKAGLMISTLRIDGVVRGPSGMIAVVSNPQQRVYFLREGDQLYDGRVEKISMEAVSFHQTGKDAFGKPVERQVSKRLYPISGEQP